MKRFGETAMSRTKGGRGGRAGGGGEGGRGGGGGGLERKGRERERTRTRKLYFTRIVV